MYKTAKELKITAGERKWLLKTAKVLATMSPNDARQIDGVNMGFDLSQWFSPYSGNDKCRGDKNGLCGTVGCIKGWMGTLAFASDNAIDLGVKLKGKKALPSKFVGKPYVLTASWRHSVPLTKLFTPHWWIDGYEKVTPKDAAKTVIRFLKTGLVEYPMKYYGHNRHMEKARRLEERRELRIARNLARARA